MTMADMFFSNSGGWQALPENTKAELLSTPAEQMTDALMKITKERFRASDSPEKRALEALKQKYEADMAELNKEHARQREEELKKLYNIYASIRGRSWEDLPEEEKKKVRAMSIREAGKYSQESAGV